MKVICVECKILQEIIKTNIFQIFIKTANDECDCLSLLLKGICIIQMRREVLEIATVPDLAYNINNQTFPK